MKNRKQLLWVFGLFLFFVGQPLGGLAATIGNPQVTVRGSITFYQEETSSSQTTSNSDNQLGGKLPDTGETAGKISLIAAGLFLLGTLIFWIKKRDKGGKPA